MIELVDKCPICGGNAGRIPPGGHYLCQARRRLSLPTPSLGTRCERCRGSGNLKRPMPAGVYLPINPSPKALRLWYPDCPDCGGKGSK